MDFLQLAGKSILVFGVANRKSVAFHVGRVLEEAGGEPFLEPMDKTLAKSSDYVRSYRQSAAGRTDPRADWLIREIGRLTGLARASGDSRRRIHGVALAAIAEWRARALLERLGKE